MFRKRKIIFLILLILFFSVSVFADVKDEVYLKLKCCDCGKDFTTCVCPHAKEIKAYIDGLIEVGVNKEDIFMKIVKKFSLDKINDEKLRKEIEAKLMSEAGDNRPQIFIEPLNYDLGEISKGLGELVLKVKLKNKGKAPLKIKNLKVSCVCVTVQLKKGKYLSPAFGVKGAEASWEATIEPKKKAELIIVTDLNHKSIHLGPMGRTITVESNDPIQPSIKISFKAEIIK